MACAGVAFSGSVERASLRWRVVDDDDKEARAVRVGLALTLESICEAAVEVDGRAESLPLLRLDGKMIGNEPAIVVYYVKFDDSASADAAEP